MDISSTAILTTIGTAVLSGLIAFGTAWFSVRKTLKSEKERRLHETVIKIADMRHLWLSELRDTLAEFQSIGVHPGTISAENPDFYRLGTKIELLMNPNDPDYKSLQDMLYQFLQFDDDIEKKFKPNSKFIEISQGILKREWERLKNELRSPEDFISDKNPANGKHRDE